MTEKNQTHWASQIGEADETTFGWKSPLVVRETDRTHKAIIVEAEIRNDDGAVQATIRIPPELRDRFKAVVSGPWTVAVIGVMQETIERLERENKTMIIENRVKR